MPEAVHSLWFDLLAQKAAELRSLKPQHILEDIPTTDTVDGYLRPRLDELRRQTGAREDQWPLPRLRYERVNNFAWAIDRALVSRPPANLAGLVAFGIFTAYAEYRAPTVLDSVVDSLNKLDHALPRLDYLVPSNTSQLHQNLRAIFHIYTGCLLDVIRAILSVPPPALINEILSHVRSARQLIKQTKEALHTEHEALQVERNNAYIPEHDPTQSHSSDDAPWHLDPQGIIGRGSFGDVYRVIERTSGQMYAVKKIPFGNNSDGRRRVDAKVVNECKNMRKLPNPHILNVCFFYADLRAQSWNIIMDVVADCDLRVFLNNLCQSGFRDTAKLNAILAWFGCLVDALSFAHRARVIHNDIKPSNILVKGNTVYLADFGLSTDFAEFDSSRDLAYTTGGTDDYKAPEMASSAPPSRRADVFSLGCVFAEMLTVYRGYPLANLRECRRRPDFDRPDPYRYLLPAVAKWLRQLRQYSNSWSPDIIFDQTLHMMAEYPEHRPTAEDVRNSLLDSEYNAHLFCDVHW
ncbi:kinase-like domain-containing protein [Aspergillus heterothallicus]